MLALVLSIVPGVGHIYRGRPLQRDDLVLASCQSRTGWDRHSAVLIHFICALNAAFSRHAAAIDMHARDERADARPAQNRN